MHACAARCPHYIMVVLPAAHITSWWYYPLPTLHHGGTARCPHYVMVVLPAAHITSWWYYPLPTLRHGGTARCPHYIMVVLPAAHITSWWYCLLPTLHHGGTTRCPHYVMVVLPAAHITSWWYYALCPCSQKPRSLVFTDWFFIDSFEIPGRDSTGMWQESILAVLEREVDLLFCVVFCLRLSCSF